jgi:subtilisin family serine protease
MPDALIPMIPDERPEFTVFTLGELKDYNIDLANVPAMWKHTRGAGVKVVVLDTGMPQHRDLLVAGAKSFIDGYLVDEQGHSTFVGGIISGQAANGTGVKGVAPDATMYYGSVLNSSGAGSCRSIADGIRWAVDEIGADVINMSLGTPGAYPCDPRIRKACEHAYESGTVVVAAAGNDASSVNWPAALDTVIAVAAVDRKLRKASFSSFGPEVEFAAGGVDVLSTYKGDTYATMSGTSFSAPVIAGIAALIVSKHKMDNRSLSPDEIREHLKAISYDIGPEGRDEYTGWGIPVFTKDTETALGKPGKPKIVSWLRRFFKSFRWW